MKPPHLSLLLVVLLLVQAGGLPGPFVYCLADGALCCSGWGEEVCCEGDADGTEGPSLDAAPSCSDVEADLLGSLPGLAQRLPDPSATDPAVLPVPSLAELDRDPGTGNRLADSWSPPGVHRLESIVLRI